MSAPTRTDDVAGRAAQAARLVDARSGWTRLRERLESPLATYYILLGTTTLLVVLGLVMVLSASSVTSQADSGSPYTVFRGQLIFAVLGTACAVVASRLSLTVLRRVSPLLFLVSLLLQYLVFTRLGVSVFGNRNWIEIHGLQVQPSEFAKVTLILFGATVLAKKRGSLGRFSHALVPFVLPAGVVLIGLVLRGRDLGTALVLFAIIAGMLWAAGVPARVFAVAGGGFAAIAAVLVVTSSNRMGRIATWIGGTCVNPDVVGCFQKVHGEYALADGGWWGVGLGASREKWSWLPEAHNDFIFAIIGEELGLPGTLLVLVLFTGLAYGCYRIVLRTDDLFVRVACAGIMVWILGQAMINIGAVIGLLPIIGVPLPLVSSGGSALVTTLAGLGLLIGFARNEPDCRAALAAAPSPGRRVWEALVGRREGRA